MLKLPAPWLRLLLLGAGVLLLSPAEAPAQSEAGVTALRDASTPDKSSSALFNPTPRDLMREISPDRPDKTESPYTVDAGHFQLEMDFANFTATETDDARIRAWKVAPINLKVGLLNQVDLQFGFDSYLEVRAQGQKPKSETMTQLGVGDFTTRLKIDYHTEFIPSATVPCARR